MPRRSILAPCVLALLLAGAAIADDKKADVKKPDAKAEKTDKTEKEKFQGEWSAVSIATTSGRDKGEAATKAAGLLVKGDAWTITSGGRPSHEMAFKLDPAKEPKHIDVAGDLRGAPIVWKGIYKVEGDTLTVCRSLPGGERPKEFKATEGVQLAVYKRAAAKGPGGTNKGGTKERR